MESQTNVLTVDLEEWFAIEALAGRYRQESWATLESTLERNCERLLSLFHRKKVHATWFVLGWCAERYPDLIRTIATSGHEIACHSYRHQQVGKLDKDAFRADTREAVQAITRAVGAPPIGYRAPSWSIDESSAWAFEILADMGFEYDSSIFPIKHDLYGMPKAPRHLFKMTFDSGRTLFELPASTQRFLGQNLPLGGGGYLRHSPYWYSQRMIRNLNRDGHPAVVYVHPWEIDPNSPKIPDLGFLARYRLYGSVAMFERKLSRLLDEFQFLPVWDYIRLTTRGRIGFER